MDLPEPFNELPQGWADRPALADAQNRYLDARVKTIEISTELAAARADLVTAEQADRDQLSQALLEGHADPGTPHSDEAQEKVDDAERRLEAMREACEAAANDVDAAYGEERKAWIAEVGADIEAKQSEAIELLDRLAELSSVLTRLDQKWLQLHGSARSVRRPSAIEGSAFALRHFSDVRDWFDRPVEPPAIPTGAAGP